MTDDRRILFFGDSFVAGVGDPTGLGWVGRVVAASHAAGRPMAAYNLGIRRDTALDVAARWRAETAARTGSPDARYGAVLSFGANDAIEENGQLRVAPAVSLDTMRRLIDDAEAIGLAVFVVGPAPVGEPAADERVGELSARFADLAHERGVPFAETFTTLSQDPAWRREAAAGDGAHPAAGGYRTLASLVLAAGWINWLE